MRPGRNDAFTFLTYSNGLTPHCPLRNGGDCDPQCALLQTDDDGSCVCSIALIPITDTFSPDIMCMNRVTSCTVSSKVCHETYDSEA